MSKSLMIFLFAAVGLAAAVGTPHLLLRAECSMFYSYCLQENWACRYLGIQGRRVVFPPVQATGRRHCPTIALLPLQWPLFRWAGS